MGDEFRAHDVVSTFCETASSGQVSKYSTLAGGLALGAALSGPRNSGELLPPPLARLGPLAGKSP